MTCLKEGTFPLEMLNDACRWCPGLPSCKDKVIMSYLGLETKILVQSIFFNFKVNF